MTNEQLIEALEIGLKNTESTMSTELSWCDGDNEEYGEVYKTFTDDIEKIKKCIDELKDSEK